MKDERKKFISFIALTVNTIGGGRIFPPPCAIGLKTNLRRWQIPFFSKSISEVLRASFHTILVCSFSWPDITEQLRLKQNKTEQNGTKWNKTE
jgi:hypothetical protein